MEAIDKINELFNLLNMGNCFKCILKDKCSQFTNIANGETYCDALERMIKALKE